jgi:hypothetical protein
VNLDFELNKKGQRRRTTVQVRVERLLPHNIFLRIDKILAEADHPPLDLYYHSSKLSGVGSIISGRDLEGI